jgi:hypothetical protein
LEISSSHSNTLYNYAVLLDTHLKRKSDAEIFYRRTLEVEERHSYALYNLAVLLEEKHFHAKQSLEKAPADSENKKYVEEVGGFYRRAAECDARDPNTLADLGRFLYLYGENPVSSEPILIGSLKLDPRCETALYYLALLQYK